MRDRYFSESGRYVATSAERNEVRGERLRQPCENEAKYEGNDYVSRARTRLSELFEERQDWASKRASRNGRLDLQRRTERTLLTKKNWRYDTRDALGRRSRGTEKAGGELYLIEGRLRTFLFAIIRVRGVVL